MRTAVDVEERAVAGEPVGSGSRAGTRAAAVALVVAGAVVAGALLVGALAGSGGGVPGRLPWSHAGAGGLSWNPENGPAPAIDCDGGSSVSGIRDSFGPTDGQPSVAAAAQAWRRSTFDGRDYLVAARTYRDPGIPGAARGAVQVVWFDARAVPRASLTVEPAGLSGWRVLGDDRCAVIPAP